MTHRTEERIQEIKAILHTPPRGRVGGAWECPLREELNMLERLLSSSQDRGDAGGAPGAVNTEGGEGSTATHGKGTPGTATRGGNGGGWLYDTVRTEKEQELDDIKKRLTALELWKNS